MPGLPRADRSWTALPGRSVITVAFVVRDAGGARRRNDRRALGSGVRIAWLSQKNGGAREGTAEV
jgi:hypothetical protein